MQPVEDHLAALILSRRDVGVKKYGVTVDENPLTTEEWIQHAIEELLDASVYLEKTRRGIAAKDARIAELEAKLAQIQQAAVHPTTGTLTREQLKVARKTPSPPKIKPCCECGAGYPHADLIAGHIYCPRCRRTPAEVDRLKRKIEGCCDRHCDNQACDCMEIAIRVHGTGCSICSNPKCDNPGGKH